MAPALKRSGHIRHQNRAKSGKQKQLLSDVSGKADNFWPQGIKGGTGSKAESLVQGAKARAPVRKG